MQTGKIELSEGEAVLLLRALHALLANVDAAKAGYAIDINTQMDERDAIQKLDAKVKDCLDTDWTTKGWALGR